LSSNTLLLLLWLGRWAITFIVSTSNMNFGSSQQVKMKMPVLLRRNTSAADDVQDDALTDLPVVQESTNLPTTYHKRKQSDLLVLSELDVSHEDLKSTYSSLSPIEQGTAADAEDADACYDGRSLRWTNSLSPFFSSCQFMVLFMVLAASATLHSVRSRSKNTEDPYYSDGGFDDIGEPREAQLPDEEWIEFYSSPERMPAMKSAGPWPVDPKVGGLYKFENVCVTNNIDAPKPPELDTSSRGLLYFTNTVKDQKRCVPCSKSQMNSRVEDKWNAATSDSAHICGMKGLHAMMAKSVGDYNDCMENSDNHKLMIRARQNQSPSHVSSVHFFEDPTFLLAFDAHDREKSLFDMLLTYLPHWHKFKSEGFPFNSVISHSVQGCLTHSKSWLCEVLHQTEALGYAQELQWERKDSTLYCFKSLYYNQLEYQRDLKHEGLVTKTIMDDFRDELFRNLALPGPRDMSDVWKKDAKLAMKRPINIALYANGKNVWKDLDKLVGNARSRKDYHNLEFNVINNFDDLTVAEQATAFNLADAVVSSTGDHMANAIFSPDNTFFAEAGCSHQSLTSNSHFMALLLGTHKSVVKCAEGQSADEICALCSGDGSFSMTEKHFRSLLDDIMKHHKDKVSFSAPE